MLVYNKKVCVLFCIYFSSWTLIYWIFLYFLLLQVANFSNIDNHPGCVLPVDDILESLRCWFSFWFLYDQEITFFLNILFFQFFRLQICFLVGMGWNKWFVLRSVTKDWILVVFIVIRTSYPFSLFGGLPFTT